MNIRKQLEQLRNEVPISVRGEWNHYRCFMCDDKSAHLGINVSRGWVRCLRCGFSFVLDSALVVPKPKRKYIGSLEDRFSNEAIYPVDDDVKQYMTARGVPNPNVGWAYGRGLSVGQVAFPIRDESGGCVYLQYRSIEKGGRYRSVPGTCPRLDFYPVVELNAPPHTLILTEGPVDSLRIRQVSNMWASPAFGMSIGYTGDLYRAMVGVGLKRIIVWLDAEPTAEINANRMVRDLRRELCIRVTAVSWRVLDDADPGAIPDTEIIQTLSRIL